LLEKKTSPSTINKPFCGKATFQRGIFLFLLQNVDVQEVELGGEFQPDCEPYHEVAIVVPYRDRQEHLALFLWHYHKVL